MAEATLTSRIHEAIPELPPAFRAARTLLALDLGTATGWALHGVDGLITNRPDLLREVLASEGLELPESFPG